MRIPLYVLLCLISLVISAIIAGSVPSGGSCSASSNTLDPASHKFVSECTDATFCSAASNGTCVPRLCRRDEFPFRSGDSLAASVPPLCNTGFFCPDEGTGCKPQVPVGSACQLNRDEQCAPPSEDWNDQAAGSQQSFNGSICLHSFCMYANASLDQSCIIEETLYVELLGVGQTFSHTISRHNCRSPELYCDATTNMTCQFAKHVGVACASDVECLTRNCDGSICANIPGLPVVVPLWKWTVIAAAVSSTLIALSAALTFLRRNTIQNHQRELREYYVEQLGLRKSIIQLHTTATAKFPGEKF